MPANGWKDDPGPGLYLLGAMMLLFVAGVAAWPWLSRLSAIPDRTIYVGGGLALLAGGAAAAVPVVLAHRKLTALKKRPGAIYLGRTAAGELWITPEQRTTHCSITGSTGSGKTASVILPALTQDIRSGCSVIAIDGKPDLDFLRSLVATAKATKRMDDFRLLTLNYPDISDTYNPLLTGDNIDSIAGRIFAPWEQEMTEPFYRDMQKTYFTAAVQLLVGSGWRTNFRDIYWVLASDAALEQALDRKPRSGQPADYQSAWRAGKAYFENEFLSQDRNMVNRNIGGLMIRLRQFAFGTYAPLLNDYNPTLDLADVTRNGRVFYAQLPVGQGIALAPHVGRMLAEHVQTVIQRRYRDSDDRRIFCSVIMDEFAKFASDEQTVGLAQVRGANAGYMFSFQSLADLKKVSKEFFEQLMVNTRLKVILNSPDFETAETLANLCADQVWYKAGETQEREGPLQIREWDRKDQMKERATFTPQEILSMPVGKGHVVVPNLDARADRGAHYYPFVEFDRPVSERLEWDECVRRLGDGLAARRKRQRACRPDECWGLNETAEKSGFSTEPSARRPQRPGPKGGRQGGQR